MRTRNRTVTDVVKTVSSLPSNYLFEDCGGVITAGSNSLPAFSYPVKGREEEMRDELGRESTHPVEHRRWEWDLTITDSLGKYFAQDIVPGVIKYTDAATNSWWSRIAYLSFITPASGLAYFNVSTNPLVSHPPPDRWSYSSLSSAQESSLKEDCFEKARELKADALLNLCEANQVWPGIQSMAKALPWIKRKWPTLRKELARVAKSPTIRQELAQLKREAKAVAGGYLAYKFGALPLFGDIENTNRFLPKLADDYRSHVEGDVKRFSSSAELITAFNDNPLLGSQHGYPVVVFTPKGKINISPTVRYVLRVRPNQQYMTDFFKKFDHLMNRFATSPASLAWELVPFSFVADWFVDMRGFLRQLDTILGFEPFEIVGLTRSFSYKLSTSYTYEHRKTCAANTVMIKGPFGDFGFSHYERRLASITPDLVHWKPRFGNNQARISAALIAQNLL